MVRIQRYRKGTRVTITRGGLPLDPGLLGRSGTVMAWDPWNTTRYAVRLDGEHGDVRIFEEAELLEEETDPGGRGARGTGASPGAAAHHPTSSDGRTGR